MGISNLGAGEYCWMPTARPPVYQGHTSYVGSAVFSPDGERIVTASQDQAVRVIRVVTLSQIAELLAK